MYSKNQTRQTEEKNKQEPLIKGIINDNHNLVEK